MMVLISPWNCYFILGDVFTCFKNHYKMISLMVKMIRNNQISDIICLHEMSIKIKLI